MPRGRSAAGAWAGRGACGLIEAALWAAAGSAARALWAADGGSDPASGRTCPGFNAGPRRLRLRRPLRPDGGSLRSADCPPRECSPCRSFDCVCATRDGAPGTPSVATLRSGDPARRKACASPDLLSTGLMSPWFWGCAADAPAPLPRLRRFLLRMGPSAITVSERRSGTDAAADPAEAEASRPFETGPAFLPLPRRRCDPPLRLPVDAPSLFGCPPRLGSVTDVIH